MAKKTSKTEEKKQEQKFSVGTRGRTFEGMVIKKFSNRVVVEFERTVYIPKYERFYRKKTKLHARLPENFEIKVGDYIKIRECRPLSKIIHFIVIQKIRSAEVAEEKVK